ncbi:MAG: hypothetical protein PHV68_07375 [Candidatus Gastranaerophilales bacterium]|nr:hypothetical protein [Candidatus Gastranaerophilales bacterium]
MDDDNKKNGWEILGEVLIKYASLAVVGALLYFGVDLLCKAEKIVSIAAICGAGLIFVAIVLSVLFFMDRWKREGYEHIINQQSLVIKGLTSQITETNKTGAFREKRTRSSLTDDNWQKDKTNYKVDDEDRTENS